MKLIRMAVLAVALLGAAACGKKGAAECAKWVDRSVECDPDLKGMSAGDLAQGKQMLEQICTESMSGADPGGEAEVRELAMQMMATVKAKTACTSAASCAEFNACEKAIDDKTPPLGSGAK